MKETSIHSPPPGLAHGVRYKPLGRLGGRLGLLSGAANGLTVVCGALAATLLAFTSAPSETYPIERTLTFSAKRPLVLLTREGEPFARRGDCMATPVTLDELPRHLIDAVLAMEDRRFYSHFGVDPQGVMRAAQRNLEAGALVEGGSTITQQLAKLSYLSPEKTFERKREEALVALWLELRLTKDQILERYLSRVYFGEGCFGVRAAAKHYFDKSVSDLTLSESVLLVALLRSPTRLSRNFDDARERARLVLEAMVQDGRLDADRAAAVEPAEPREGRARELGAYYADWLADSLVLEDPHSPKPVSVYTTFEPRLQRNAERAVGSVLETEGDRRNATQAALVAMRTDGRVVAMVGGRERATSQFNRAMQARRQPGSAFKMFVYLAALRAGATADMVVTDQPVSISGWEPKNFGGGFRGDVSLERAFAASINTVAVRVSEAIGRDDVIAAARDLGITSPLPPHPSIALGVSEVSLLELTAAFAAIAAGAYPVLPWGAAGLDAEPVAGGAPPAGAGRWGLPEAEAMRDLLAAVVRGGTGRGARLPIGAFGKTGTSQEYRDAWFVGFAGNLVVGIWVGNDDDSPMRRVTGGDLPARIWRTFMRDALESDPGFERDLPRIAAFQARTPEVDRASRRAALENIVTVAAARENHGPAAGGSGRSGLSDARRSRSSAPQAILVGREDTLDRSAPPGRRAEQSGRSSDFSRQLRDMGWPGH